MEGGVPKDRVTRNNELTTIPPETVEGRVHREGGRKGGREGGSDDCC